MDKQTAFDTIVKGIMTQGEKSVNRVGHCRYRGDDNRRCAIGILIPDEKYHAGLECTGLFNMVEMGILPNCCDNRTDTFLFYGEMQDVHDRSEPEVWERKFKAIAKAHNLTMPV